jgi:hypothetical protein
MKITVAVLSVAFSVYVAIQSYVIAEAGATYQVVQLEGDGGGGLVFALLCIIAGLLVFVRPLLSAGTFILASVMALGVGILYGDNAMLLWAVVPVALTAVNVYLHIALRRKRRLVTGQVVAE